MDLSFLLEKLGYLGIFFGMIVVGIIGVFPPSKLLYFFSGFSAYLGFLSFFWVIFFGALGHSIGNYLQYFVAKFRGKKIINKFLFFSKEEILKFEITFKKNSYLWLFFGKLLDPAKLFVCLIAGYTNMKVWIFLPIVFLSSIIWAFIFTYLGYYFGGESFESFGFIGPILLFIGIYFIFIFYKKMNSKEILDEVKTATNNKQELKKKRKILEKTKFK